MTPFSVTLLKVYTLKLRSIDDGRQGVCRTLLCRGDDGRKDTTACGTCCDGCGRVHHLSAGPLRGHEEISESLYLAMRDRSRAVWSTIKHRIEGIEEEVAAFKEKFQAEK